MTDSEPSLHRLKSMHHRVLDINEQSMDMLHHLIYESDLMPDEDCDIVEDQAKNLRAMTLMGKPKYKGEINA